MPAILSSLCDISESKQANDLLRQLSSAVEQAGESVVISDKNGVIEYVNPAFTALTGYSAGGSYRENAAAPEAVWIKHLFPEIIK